MTGSNPSGRQPQRRSGHHSSSSFIPNHSRSKRRRNSPRQSKSFTNAAQASDLSARPPRALRRVGSNRQKGKGPINLPSSGEGEINAKMRPSKLARSTNSQMSRNDYSADAYYTSSYPGQRPSPSQVSGPTTDQHQAYVRQQFAAQPQRQLPTHRSVPGGQGNQGLLPGQPSHNTQPQSGANPQGDGQSQASRTTWDIRLGPEPRRRPQLSSNPAFGRSRITQRSGSEIIMPQASAQMYHGQSFHREQPAQYPLPKQSLSRSGIGAVPMSTSSLSKSSTARTQTIRPLPVNRRPASKRSGRRRSPTRLSSRTLTVASPHVLPAADSPQQKKSISPLVYGARILILGIGLGSIAGTLISALDPASIPGGTGLRSNPSAIENNPTETESTALGNADESLTSDPSFPSFQKPLRQQASSNIGSLSAVPKQSSYSALTDQLRTMANNMPDLTPGIFALDLDTYNYVDLNGSTTFSAASIIKVPILVAFLQDVEHNKIRLDETLVMQEGDVAGGSGDMRLGTIGDTYSALETAKKMIVISDNTATNMLIRRMGGIEQLNRRFRSWGLTTTVLRNPLPDLEGTNTTSPAEMTHLMTVISHGQLLEMRSRDRMLDIMYQTETATLLPAGIGGNAEIAHKTGDIGSMVGDTGLVDTSSGKRYAITIMMRRPHNDTRAQELIRQMVGVIHRELQTPSVSTTPSSAVPSTKNLRSAPPIPVGLGGGEAKRDR